MNITQIFKNKNVRFWGLQVCFFEIPFWTGSSRYRGKKWVPKKFP